MERTIGARRSDRPEQGFTLIELLVTVAVLAVLAVGATLATGRSASPGESDIALFRAQFDRMRALAMTSRQTRGLIIAPGGMLTAHRNVEGWTVSNRRIEFDQHVVMAKADTPDEIGHSPQILFLASGRTTPFVLNFDGARCESDGWSELTCGG